MAAWLIVSTHRGDTLVITILAEWCWSIGRHCTDMTPMSSPSWRSCHRFPVHQQTVRQASHWHARQGVYAMARNLTCRWGKNSWQCAWRCGSGKVVRAVSWRRFWNVQKFISKVSRLVTTISFSAHRMRQHAFREQLVTYAWQLARVARHCADCVTLPSWQTSCLQNGTTWHAILRGSVRY